MSGLPSERRERVARLLEASLAVWRVAGRVERPDAGDDVVARVRGADGTVVTVARVELPDGSRHWQVAYTAPGESAEDAARRRRPRTYASVVGLLRGVRRALGAPDPPGRLIVTPKPLFG